ncbi:thioredoxin-dependent thiol peroxidase [soil metagenome]
MTARLEPGDAAPDFELREGEGKTWRLDDLRGKKVILYFYPADDTPGCTAQACDFRDAHQDLREAGYTVLGVSPQDESSHRAFAAKYRLNFPLLVDCDHAVAARYGAWSDGDSGGGGRAGVIRSTFVISEDGAIVEADYGVDARQNVTGLKELLGI